MIPLPSLVLHCFLLIASTIGGSGGGGGRDDAPVPVRACAPSHVTITLF